MYTLGKFVPGNRNSRCKGTEAGSKLGQPLPTMPKLPLPPIGNLLPFSSWGPWAWALEVWDSPHQLRPQLLASLQIGPLEAAWSFGGRAVVGRAGGQSVAEAWQCRGTEFWFPCRATRGAQPSS